MRQRMKKSKDRKVFKQTANKTHRINVGGVVPRGGVRL